MKKYKIAFIKYSGLSTGGTERWLQMMAANLNKERFMIDFYYCDATPYLNDNYQHPDTDSFRKEYLEKNNIRLIKFFVKLKDASKFYCPWIETDFFDIFDESKYDLIQTAKAGNPEYPYIYLNNSKIIEYVTLSGGVDLTKNIKRSIHLSRWQLNEWLRNGGSLNKADIIPVPVEKPSSKDNFRKELNISKDTIVCGFHQRSDNRIFSPVQLEAYKNVESSKTFMIVLGGGEKYKQQALELNIKNIVFLDHTGDSFVISKFLNTIDIFTHGRSDGETFGTVLAEAMIHKKPCLSHYVRYPGANAMAETIGPGGFVLDDIIDYVSKLNELISDKNLRESLSIQAYEFAHKNYSIEACVAKLEQVYINTISNNKNNNKFLCIKKFNFINLVKNYIKLIIIRFLQYKRGL